jgi:hypothetical protein
MGLSSSRCSLSLSLSSSGLSLGDLGACAPPGYGPVLVTAAAPSDRRRRYVQTTSLRYSVALLSSCSLLARAHRLSCRRLRPSPPLTLSSALLCSPLRLSLHLTIRLLPRPRGAPKKYPRGASTSTSVEASACKWAHAAPPPMPVPVPPIDAASVHSYHCMGKTGRLLRGLALPLITPPTARVPEPCPPPLRSGSKGQPIPWFATAASGALCPTGPAAGPRGCSGS